MKPILSFLLLSLCVAEFSPGAEPGDLDPSFGNGGVVKFTGFGFGDDRATAMTTTADGRLIVAGASGPGQYYGGMSMIRLNADSTLDTTFGRFGKVITNIPGFYCNANSVRMQADGKILLGGQVATTDFKTADFLLARYNADGSLDSGFGAGGVVRTDILAIDFIQTVRVQTDGKILVAGTARDSSSTLANVVLARYLTDGSPDPAFGNRGVMHQTGAGNNFARDMVIQSDGKILVATDKGEKMTAQRFSASGAADTTFGTAGVATATLTGTHAICIAIQPAGLTADDPQKILLGGYAGGSSSDRQFAVARFSMAGVPDTSFSGDGVATTRTGNLNEQVNALLVETTIRGPSRILAAGYSADTSAHSYRTRFTVAKYLLGGGPDTAFDGDGVLVTPIGSGDESDATATAAVIQSGKLLVGGFTSRGGQADFVVTRHSLSSGALDQTYGDGGVRIQDVGDGPAGTVGGLAAAPDGKILAAGVVPSDGNTSFSFNLVGVTRLLADGSVDPSFAGDGARTLFGDVNPSASSSPTPVLVQPDGKVLVACTAVIGTDSKFALFRLNDDGGYDPGFGGGSGVVTDVGPGPDVVSVMALQPDGKILVAGVNQNPSGGQLAITRHLPDGTLDTTFDGDGKVTTAISAPGEILEDLKLQADGKILLTARTPNLGAQGAAFEMMRLLPNGSPDSGFGSFGRVVTPLGYSSASFGIALQPDRKIILTGIRINGITPLDVAVATARYLPDGTLDVSFDGDGVAMSPVGVAISIGIGAAVLPNGKILNLAAAQIGTENKTAFLRLLPNGALDSAYGAGGKALGSLNLDFIGPYPFVLDSSFREIAANADKIVRMFTDSDTGGAVEIRSITRLGNGHIQIQGRGVSGAAYAMRASPSLNAGGFSTLGTVTPDSGGNWTFEDAATAGIPKRFYLLSSP